MADAPKIGQIYRDTYADKSRRNLRTIRVTEVRPNGVMAVVLTDVQGRALTGTRVTNLLISSLRAGYELVSEAA